MDFTHPVRWKNLICRFDSALIADQAREKEVCLILVMPQLRLYSPTYDRSFFVVLHHADLRCVFNVPGLA
jgi:hypothetical protein